MKTINVKLTSNGYKIVVGNNILSQLGEKIKPLKLGEDAYVITNAKINKLYGKQLQASLVKAGFSVKVFLVPDGEKSKSASEAMRLIERIAKYDVYKKPFVVAFGGGVIGDLAGYVAAAYKRGIPYIQVPTTLLAQIDSAIGGKVAIDLPIGKNLVGAFYQPRIVYSDVAVLKSLDNRQMRNGFAEAIKYGVIDDKQLFQYIFKNYKALLKKNLELLTPMVISCSQIKSKVVVADEFEKKNIRVILNFGHTVGHAIEAAGKYKQYQHGEAIALGMRIATDMSYQMGLLKDLDVKKINDLISMIGLPKKLKTLKVSQILNLMKHDKKFVSGKNKFILAQNIGEVKVVEGVSLDIIKKSIQQVY